jgi:hypothetical protein
MGEDLMEAYAVPIGVLALVWLMSKGGASGNAGFLLGVGILVTAFVLWMSGVQGVPGTYQSWGLGGAKHYEPGSHRFLDPIGPLEGWGR